MDFVKGIFKISNFAFSLKSDKREFNSLHDKDIIWDESDAILLFKEHLCLCNGFEGRVVVCFSGNAVERIRIIGCAPAVPVKDFTEKCERIDMENNAEIEKALGIFGSAVEYIITSDNPACLIPAYKTGKLNAR